MNRYLLFILLMAGILLAMFQQSSYGRYGEEIVDQNDVDNDVDSVAITLTHLDVNDTNLELGFKIINNTDHDVWICNGYEYPDGSICYFDRFMDEDNKTLVLRRRYNFSLTWLERNDVPRNFRYLRLSPGQEKVESHSFTLPVTRLDIYLRTPGGKADFAQRLAIEIGFYDEDLRALILDVVDIAERIGYDDSTLSEVTSSDSQSLYYRFFGGFTIARTFKKVTYFRDSVNSDDDEILMPPMNETLNGEQVLRLEVDNVSIPYKSNYPPLTDDPTQGETEPTGVTMALTKFDVNDTSLELSWKIINNTDHDVWICNGNDSGGSIHYFERWMEKDNKTLVLRRRYNLSSEGIIVERFPSYFRYLFLRPGQEKVESHSFTLPVTSTSPLFQRSGSGGLNVDSAQRLVIEIGFYDEDLRALILGVVDMAESLGCNDYAILTAESETPRLFYRFFGGFEIAGWFKNRDWFRGSVTSDGDEILMGYMHQALNGEQILRIEVDNLKIPFSLL